MKLLFSLFIALLWTTSTLAEIKKDPHHEGLLSTINLGLRYSSVLEHRGVILYNDFQIDPFIAVFFLDDRVEFLGDSIGFRDFAAGNWLRLRTRLQTITDDALFPNRKSVRLNDPARADTFEWQNRAEIFLPGYDGSYWGEIDIGIAKDLKEHEGIYSDLQVKVKTFDFRLPYADTLIEPNLFAGVGWGSSAHNQYLYGPSSNKSGLTNYTYGVWFAFPEESDRFYPIIQIRHFEATSDFASGTFANGRSDGWLFSFIASAQVF